MQSVLRCLVQCSDVTAGWRCQPDTGAITVINRELNLTKSSSLNSNTADKR